MCKFQGNVHKLFRLESYTARMHASAEKNDVGVKFTPISFEITSACTTELPTFPLDTLSHRLTL